MDAIAGNPLRPNAGLPCRRGGYTLIELMTVLAILAIVLALAVPALAELIQRQKIAATTADLLAAIRLTRAEALRRGQRIDLVPADGVEWAGGWMIFIDDNGNRRADAGETILHVHDAVAPGLAIKSAMTDRGAPYIAYAASGRTRTNANSQTPQFGHLSLSLGAQQRRIIINFLGRARSCNPLVEGACG
ncbi:GspH/FimT family pseudopilin [Actimicrobium sp. CCC2.4]|uniref:GspH/FimT family pseudopilin n=1 Tax=Actimicrobium sp. CCC2.4 TaxID=3048606 RepID=UPI002AC9B8F4|nr:GspH/FimT family pseudopilin [Actimicrobium sp. CCC2.4]MEB0137307.1 GspH/FimT family pseudopilin [Actimicrobium sp. CCC2.4]WPX31802.1 GspH/FimT family pseudopilin [Actimicrobium sp. CCC2.4]